MQIFFLDNDPIAAAESLYTQDKRRAGKQLLEGVQLLNNCCVALGIDYRPKTVEGRYYIKRNFPKVFQEWVLTSCGNLSWFNLFLQKLADELDYPKSAVPIKDYNNLDCVYSIAEKIPFSGRTPFPNYAKSVAKGLDFTNIIPTTLAYNMYLQEQLK